MKDIVFTPSALKQWTKLSADIRARIDKRLTVFAKTGNGDARRLKGARDVGFALATGA